MMCPVLGDLVGKLTLDGLIFFEGTNALAFLNYEDKNNFRYKIYNPDTPSGAEKNQTLQGRGYNYCNSCPRLK